MKTVMHELVEELKILRGFGIKISDEYISGLLEKEKEQMFHSFYAGNGVWIDEDFETEFKKYYNQTYSNE
jgi:hypothetical protein